MSTGVSYALPAAIETQTGKFGSRPLTCPGLGPRLEAWRLGDTMRRAKRNRKRNGKSKKQPRVGRWAVKSHCNKYATFSKVPHGVYGTMIE